jgi:hypothetical protein
MNLSTNALITRVMNGVSAGQAATNSSALDMYGYDSVTFIAAMGDIAGSGTATLKAQQSSDNGVADGFSDLLGTSIAYTDADDNKLAVLEIDAPQKRYVRCVLTTATSNGVKDGVIAIQTKSTLGPVTQGTTVVSAELHHAPAEGTA